MRTPLVSIAVFIANVALAQEKFDVALFTSEDAKGTRVQFRTDTQALARTPEWTPGSQEPPFSVSAATRAAVEAGKRRLPKADDIAINSIALQKSESYGQSAGGLGRLVRWYYVFTVSSIIAGDTFHGASATSFVVLFDGSIVEPSTAK